jgi:NADPH:quinone reductase-like Zn-dependent oxidoreductase
MRYATLKKSRIVRFHKTGGPDVLQIDNCLDSAPNDQEVTVRIEAFGLNRAECMLRQGVYAFNPILPCRIGGEGSGTISSVGRKVHKFSTGDKVAVIPFAIADENGYWKDETGKYGCYGETVTVPEHGIVSVPKGVSAVTNAASWMQYLTAWGALVHHAVIRSDDTVLITAASSSAALGGIHVCKDFGARVIAATRSSEKVEALIAAGADHVITADEGDYSRNVHEITGGRGATVIFDPVSGSLTNTLLTAASPEARIICYGNLDQENASFPALNALTKRVSIKFYSLYDITRRSELLEKAHEYVYQRLEDKRFEPVIDTVFHGLESCVEAHRRMESNQQFGKIVVEI